MSRRTTRVIRRTICIVLGGAVLLTSHGGIAQSGQTGESASPALEARTRAFLEAVRSHNRQRIASFFPTQGEFTYVHTAHHREGDRVQTLSFPAKDARSAIDGGRLWTSFDIQYENQPIGLFAHQVFLRGVAWHRVDGNRFVPPGDGASSAIYVEWRREGRQWVISSFGDERFTQLPMPSWCC